MSGTAGRVGTGIDGLDEMLGGGFPDGHAIALMGSCGTGKTTFAMQFIHLGLRSGEKGMVISLEEDRDSILKNCENYGWDLKPYIEKNMLRIYKVEPSAVKNTLSKIQADLTKEIKDFGARRIVVDSVSLLNMMFENPADRRTMLFKLCRQIKDSGATAVFTAEVMDDNPSSSRDGLVEYVADGVVLLKYEESSSHDVQLTIRIVKMRRAGHTRAIKPYEITPNGLMVMSKADVFLK